MSVGTSLFVRWLLAVLALPVMVMLIIPAGVVFIARSTAGAHSVAPLMSFQLWAGIGLAAVGVMLAGWSAGLFVRHGEGTAAPWDPTQQFIVRGPYRYVRNPMISGVIAVLLAEALVLQSWPLLGWAVLFTVGNLVYMPFVEEPGLLLRFGEEYAAYKRGVPRWIPRLTPWRPEG